MAAPFASLRGLPRSFWLLWTGALINRLGGFVVPFLALYLTAQRGLSVARAGAIVSLFGLGSLLAGPLGGVLADHLGRRRTLLAGLVAGSLAMLHLGFARTPLHIAIAAFALGFLGDIYRPALNAAVADLVAPAERVRAYAVLYWAANLGFALACSIAGVVAGRSFLALFIADAATTLLFAAVVFFRVPESQSHEHRAHAREGGARNLLVPLRDGVYMSFVALVFLTALLLLQSLVTLPLDMRAHGIAPDRYGVLIALNGVEIVLLQPFIGSLMGQFRRSRVLAVSALLVGGGFAINAFAGIVGVPLYALSIGVWTLGEILLSPVAPAVVADLAPGSLRGTYQGVYQMAWGAAFCVAPLTGSLVLGHFGASTLWLSCAAIGIAVAVLHLGTAGARRRRLLQLRA